MKRTLLIITLLLSSFLVLAQDSVRQHRIVMQLTSGDTLVHKNLMKQFKNMLEAAPTLHAWSRNCTPNSLSPQSWKRSSRRT